MAVLSPSDLATLRQEFAVGRTVAHTKPQINAVLQAIEDFIEANRVALGTAIEAAAPGVFNAGQKRDLVKFWLRSKFLRGG